jgi:integrase
MRRGDYPKGDSIGVRIATKEAILKAIEHKATRHKAITNAVILFLKDSGLRVSDAQLLNYADISRGLASEAKFIPITLITKKVKITARTFIGEEAIQALRTYLEARQHGTRRLPPETLTENSPLFRTWNLQTVKRIPRTTLSNVVRTAFYRINEPAVSAHSLRKYLQTNLEAANVNVNWIDQILGHKLINSRDAYSKPTDEQLQEAYAKAYKFLRVYPDLSTTKPQSSQNAKTNETTEDEEFVVKTAQNLSLQLHRL